MSHSIEDEQTQCPSWELYKNVSACFNALRAVFLEIFGYIHTDTQKVLFL